MALELAIEGMSCGACAAKIQRQVSTLPEVEDVTVDFTDGSLHARANGNAADRIINVVEDLGYHVIDDALARADIGIAMGSGTDVAAETAGITLLRSDPLLVADCLDIANRTYSKIKQNLWWAFLFNSAGIPLAAAGLLNPMIAGAAMAFSSVMVVGNALLLQRWQAPSTT